MNGYKSVTSFYNQSHNLHLLGYSEEQINDLIMNGDIRGRKDTQTGQMMIEESETIGFLPDRFESTNNNKANFYDE